MQIYMISMNIGLFFLPLFVLIIIYWRIVRQLLSDKDYINPQKFSHNIQARKQVNLTTVYKIASTTHFQFCARHSSCDKQVVHCTVPC